MSVYKLLPGGRARPSASAQRHRRRAREVPTQASRSAGSAHGSPSRKLAACLAGTNGTRRVGVEKYESTVMLCSCGSGEQPYKVHDGHGIYLTHACGDECEGKKLAKFRPDIMSRYDADEPIEPNY